MDSINANNYQFDNAQANSLLSSYQKDSEPPIYLEEDSETSRFSNGMVGLTLLGVLGLAGVGLGIYKHRQVAGLKNDLKKLQGEKDNLAKDLKSAKENISKINDELAEAKNKIENLQNTPEEDFKLPEIKHASKITKFFKKFKFWK